MMSLTFGLFNQVSGLGPLGPLDLHLYAQIIETKTLKNMQYLLF